MGFTAQSQAAHLRAAACGGRSAVEELEASSSFGVIVGEFSLTLALTNCMITAQHILTTNYILTDR